MSRRITALERAFSKAIQPEKVSLNDTRRKGLELHRKITAGESIPEPPELSARGKELRAEVMEKLDKVRGQ